MPALNLRQIAVEMKRCYDRAPSGRDCSAWWHFLDACRLHYRTEPQSDAAASLYPPQWFADVWLDVAKGESLDYHPDTGQWRGVPAI
jgi:hypothetical protein